MEIQTTNRRTDTLNPRKQDLYVHIHSQFSLILKTTNRQRIEKVVQGRRPKRVVVDEVRRMGSLGMDGWI